MNKYIKTIISAIQSWATGVIRSSTADLSQNDSNALNYVRNRTHWEEVKKVVICPETSLSYNTTDFVEFDNSFSLIVGQTYVVNFNGVKYECVGTRIYEIVSIGNSSIMGVSGGNGEPFLIAYAAGYGAMFAAETAGEYTLSISTMKSIIHKIDNKFLPDSANSMVVTISENSNGDFIANKTFDEILSAINSKRIVYAIIENGNILYLYTYASSYIVFANTNGDYSAVYSSALVIERDNHIYHYTYTLNKPIQSDWNITSTSSLAYIKNKPDIEGMIDNKLLSTKDSIILKDSYGEFEYVVQIHDGSLVSFCKCDHIEIVEMPTKTEYTAGGVFDNSGMVVNAVGQDGKSRIIENYSYPKYIDSSIIGATSIDIQYIEGGITYTAPVSINVVAFDPAVELVDFEYTANADGTYTITTWKETLNGEASTEMIIPDNHLIIV